MKLMARLAATFSLALLPTLVTSSAWAQAVQDEYWGDYYDSEYYDNDVYDEYGWDYDWGEGWEYETTYGTYEYDYDWWDGWELEYDDDWWI